MPKVRELMTMDVKTADPDCNLVELATMMKNEEVGSIPVLDEEELIGIVTDRDIVLRCIAEGDDPADTTAEEIITDEPVTISPDSDVQEASRIMAENQIRRLPVVEDNRLVGMISLGDIAVKHEDERVSGSALEDISEGVKPSRGSKARSKTVPITQGRGKAAQGISHEQQASEQRQQQRVNASRAGGRPSRRKTG